MHVQAPPPVGCCKLMAVELPNPIGVSGRVENTVKVSPPPTLSFRKVGAIAAGMASPGKVSTVICIWLGAVNCT